MNWYIAKIVFKISAGNSDRKPQFDEQLRLISAESEGDAFLKARTIGIAEEDSFPNDQNKVVKWEFINASEIIPLNKIEDGMEIYSRIHETDEAKSYIQCIHRKAIFLRTHSES